MLYICVEKCWHKGTLYKIGRKAKFTDPKDGPRSKDGRKLLYFEEVDSIPVPGETRAEQLDSEVVRLKAKVADLEAAKEDQDADLPWLDCAECDWRTKYATALKRHMTTKHPEIE